MTPEQWYRFHFRVTGELTEAQKRFVEFLSKPAIPVKWPESIKGEMFEVNEYNDMKPRREEHEEPKVYKEENKTAWTSFNS